MNIEQIKKGETWRKSFQAGYAEGIREAMEEVETEILSLKEGWEGYDDVYKSRLSHLLSKIAVLENVLKALSDKIKK